MVLFGDNFLWGTATAAYQVEGGITNNWTGAGKAVDHYNRYKEDIDIIKDMHNNAYRFSIEWSRIEPYKGVWNRDEIDHYKNVISYLQSQKIEPIVTMLHFTLPKWFPGWENATSIRYFTRYAQLLLKEFPSVKYWITINEPIIYALVSYLLGEWPPYIKNPLKAYRVVKNLAKAHWVIFNKAERHVNIGFSKNMIYFRNVACGMNWVVWLWNKWWFKLVAKSFDFIGLNYYLTLDLKWSSLCRASTKYFKKTKITDNRSDLGWEIYPQGLFEILKSLKEYDIPIIITENGIADTHDIKRKKFIQDHVRVISNALDISINIIGYFHWTLMDNFEWEKGFDPKFGLLAIVDGTLERVPRESFFYYKGLITQEIPLN